MESNVEVDDIVLREFELHSCPLPKCRQACTSWAELKAHVEQFHRGCRLRADQESNAALSRVCVPVARTVGLHAPDEPHAHQGNQVFAWRVDRRRFPDALCPKTREI